jgi:autotransporter strand-loop-strand O-heptosyltransferase
LKSLKPKIYVHGSYIGDTGYNQHTRDFFRHLSEHSDIKVRNFTVGKSWMGYTENAHDNEHYINETDKKLLYKQILWNSDKTRNDYPLYPDPSKEFQEDLNIVLCETNHHLFYDNYVGPKIAYNVWESTLQPQEFFNKLLEFDELWVPSQWQKDCTINQGYPSDKIKVVPEGVDVKTFYPDNTVSHELTKDKFTFFLAGRWDYRKSIKEIIETFIKTFDKSLPVQLIVSVDNPFSNDGLETTENRLKHYGLEDERIKILHFPPREEYIRILKSCNVFVSCARSEGWNLPLIEAMACGIPSIYSDCSGQLEFAKGRGLPVRISHELPVSASNYNHFNDSIGNYYEPDFNHLSEVMMLSYEKYESLKKLALVDSKSIREEFSWENVALIGHKTILEFMEKQSKLPKKVEQNRIYISYLDGPRVEILGNVKEKYFVEFINKKDGSVVFSDTIDNNMWTACAKKYYIPWQIKVNGVVVDELNLEGKRVLIWLGSKSIGDTIAWSPYAIEFAKKMKCKVILSTHHNEWFKGLKEYEDIEFIQPGGSTPCQAVYQIAWIRDNDGFFNNLDFYPTQLNLIPLQQTATDILGLDFTEVNHGLFFKQQNRKIKEKYVVIGPQSTAGCKEWPYEYWSELSKMLKDKFGYKVISLTANKFHLDNVDNIIEKDWNNIFNYMFHSEFFIGLSSGLSWVNWALNKKTFMIAGFSRDDHEFQNNTTRISNDVCVKCWNDSVFKFDTSDWNWCPVYKGTEKQHICQKSITPFQVLNKIEECLN